MPNTYLAGEQTKRKILKESRKLFYKNGFIQTTYDDICAAAKINRALIPYYFNNKQILGQTIYHNIIENFTAAFDNILDISQFTPDFITVLHVAAYYHLLNDTRFSRFVFQLLSGESACLFTIEQEKSILLGLGNKISSLSDSELDIIIRMSIGMKKEMIQMIYHSEHTNTDQLVKASLHMLMGYAGYSNKKIEELTDAAIKVINLFSFRFKNGFLLEIKYS